MTSELEVAKLSGRKLWPPRAAEEFILKLMATPSKAASVVFAEKLIQPVRPVGISEEKIGEVSKKLSESVVTSWV